MMEKLMADIDDLERTLDKPYTGGSRWRRVREGLKASFVTFVGLEPDLLTDDGQLTGESFARRYADNGVETAVQNGGLAAGVNFVLAAERGRSLIDTETER